MGWHYSRLMHIPTLTCVRHMSSECSVYVQPCRVASSVLRNLRCLQVCCISSLATLVATCRGDWAVAVRNWKRAAKAQQPVAMFKLGHHLYKGDLTTLGRNMEDAVMWLQRFQRCVTARLVRFSATLCTLKWYPCTDELVCVSARTPWCSAHLSVCFAEVGAQHL